MIEDGYCLIMSGSMILVVMVFMCDYGVLKDIYFESIGMVYKMVKGIKVLVCMVKVLGFGFKGVLCCILLFMIFFKFKDIGGNILLLYDEEFCEVVMDMV